MDRRFLMGIGVALALVSLVAAPPVALGQSAKAQWTVAIGEEGDHKPNNANNGTAVGTQNVVA